MKSIRYILLSYFQQNYFINLLMVVGLLFFLYGTAEALSGKSLPPGNDFDFIPWTLHFFALFFMMNAMVMNLKSSIKSNTGALFPHYRRNQLIAAGFTAAFFIFVPVFIRSLQGFYVLAPLAMFLFGASLIIWGLFAFEKNLYIFPVIVWLGKLVHEMLGFKAKIMIFPSLPAPTLLGAKGGFPLLIILLSCGLFFVFVFYVLKMPYKDLWDRIDLFDPKFFSVNRFTLKILKRKMVALRGNKTGQKKRSLFQWARVLQPALFSPGYSLFINTLNLAAGFILFMATYIVLFHGGDLAALDNRFGSVSFFALFYFTGAAFMTTDLLLHRNRIPDLLFRVPVNSRNEFTRATILTYLLVAGRQFFVSSAAVVILCVFLRMPALKILLALVSGFIIYIVVLALSLLFSDKVSNEGKEWAIFTVVSGTVCFAVFGLVTRRSGYRSPDTWWFILAAGVFSLFLFWRAYKKWLDTELNFGGPDIITS